mmetsp:Transcript_25706/g.59412  ORF Transcript_25706/g.59412 Transcript_25706/m.59412 type:complete len:267 (-) Transcript_25706:127-927(-)
MAVNRNLSWSYGRVLHAIFLQEWWCKWPLPMPLGRCVRKRQTALITVPPGAQRFPLLRRQSFFQGGCTHHKCKDSKHGVGEVGQQERICVKDGPRKDVRPCVSRSRQVATKDGPQDKSAREAQGQEAEPPGLVARLYNLAKVRLRDAGIAAKEAIQRSRKEGLRDCGCSSHDDWCDSRACNADQQRRSPAYSVSQCAPHVAEETLAYRVQTYKQTDVQVQVRISNGLVHQHRHQVLYIWDDDVDIDAVNKVHEAKHKQDAPVRAWP